MRNFVNGMEHQRSSETNMKENGMKRVKGGTHGALLV
jgi:hypothetical protein